MFLKILYKVAAVGESRFLADIIQVKISKQQHILDFTGFNEFYILLTGAPVEAFEFSGKVRIAHIAHFCQLLNIKQLVGVSINIFCYIINSAVILFFEDDFVGIKSIRTPYPE